MGYRVGDYPSGDNWKPGDKVAVLTPDKYWRTEYENGNLEHAVRVYYENLDAEEDVGDNGSLHFAKSAPRPTQPIAAPSLQVMTSLPIFPPTLVTISDRWREAKVSALTLLCASRMRSTPRCPSTHTGISRSRFLLDKHWKSSGNTSKAPGYMAGLEI